MSHPKDPLRVCRHGCLLLAKHRHCPWHGLPVRPLVGLTLGNYRIEYPLSTRGGFGAVYFARNTTQRALEAAVKVLKPPHCYRPDVVRTFIYEAGLGQGIEISQIPDIYDVSETPWPHIKMAYIDGGNLEEELAGRTRGGKNGAGRELLPVDEAHGLLTGIAKALQASHQVGLIHRDLKPLNVLLSRDQGGQPEDRVRVIDWGIAMRLLDATGESSEKEHEPTTIELVHKTVESMGSLPYMAPEHFDKHTDKRSDIYQYGIIAYQVLTGEFPYISPTESSLQAWHSIHSGQTPRPLRQLRRAVPRQLARVVHRCLEKNPDRRYPDGGALLADVARRPLPFAARAAIVALLAVVGVLTGYAWFASQPTRLPTILANARGLGNIPWEVAPESEVPEAERVERPRVYWFQTLDHLDETGDVTLSPTSRLSELALHYESEGEREDVPGAVFSGGDSDETVTLSFRAIADFLRERASPRAAQTRRFRFLLTGLVQVRDTREVFEHPLTLALDGSAPRLLRGDVRISRSDLLEDDDVVLFDESSPFDLESARGERYRVYVPEVAKDVRLTLTLEVDDENLRSAPTEEYTSAEGAGGPGLELGYEVEEGEETALKRAWFAPDRSGERWKFEIDLPDIPAATPPGSERAYTLRVVDKARNSSPLPLVLILDSGIDVASHGGITKDEGSCGSFPVEWRESYPLTSTLVGLTLRDSATPPNLRQKPNVTVTDIRRDVTTPNSTHRIEFHLTPAQLESVQGAEAPWKLDVNFEEPFDLGLAPASTGVTQTGFELTVAPDREIQLADFEGQIELVLFRDGSAKKFLLIEYPALAGSKQFVYATEAVPGSIRVRQGPDHEALHGYAIDWSAASFTASSSPLEAETPAEVPQAVRQDLVSETGRDSLELALPDELARSVSSSEPIELNLTLELRSFWGEAPQIVPVVLICGKDLPALPKTTAVRVTQQQSEAYLQPGAIAEIDASGALELEMPWRPTFDTVSVTAECLSGDIPVSEAAEKTRADFADVKSHDDYAFKHEFKRDRSTVDSGGKATLTEGIYRLLFKLDDVFGNESRAVTSVRHHGQPPRIDAPRGTQLGEGEWGVEQTDKGCDFAIRVYDPSAISRVRFLVDGEAVFDHTAHALLEPDAETDLIARGVRIPPSEIQTTADGVVTSLQIVYEDLGLGTTKELEVRARDKDSPAHETTATFRVRCTTEALPELVRFRGLDWIRVTSEDDDFTFYVCRYEVSRGFRSDPLFYEREGAPSPGDDDPRNLPLTEEAPEAMWQWARDNGFYLPTLHQWLQVARGRGAEHQDLEGKIGMQAARATVKVALDDDSGPKEELPLANLVYLLDTTDQEFGDLGKQRTLAPVGLAPSVWRDRGEPDPDLFYGVLHLLGNAEETVVDPNRPGGFLRVGGSRRTRLAECLDHPEADRSRSTLGFRLIVFYENTKSGERTWLRNREFAEALRDAQDAK